MSALSNHQAFADAMPLTYKPGQHAPDMNALVRKHAALVRRIAWHVHGGMSAAIDIEDLIQTGLVALVEAAGSFEDRGLVTFQQYLATRVRGSMIDALRRHATMTRGAMRRRRAYHDAIAALTAALGHAPGEAALAEKLGVTIEKLRSDYATAEAVKFEHIDDVYADDLPWFASDEPDAFEQLAEGELREALIAAIAALPEREAQVVQLYYVEELNLEEIGLVLGVGAARVCQIKAAAHGRLKKALARRG
ncbi:sigma-70 family RNA polymerase sigma factor [Sphingomonas sp. AR_OL41]|jgi:RNA polymerase sigma factor for flagellar operon FliA|uniref:sigma-70 family RNA polymerase sigma factor n=1 Tax=Sphingomonas sp. AR_OL41 TaxID=3042729 RepID=UPI0024810D66|nr:sigma-70 family RNA polymerase sigma factor [Sphingomonas sp. AR_OL41]MDH7975906.1 sigma-70 family RNA polymerase sigma factor [Sphingomonas sp. AR_OL41]